MEHGPSRKDLFHGTHTYVYIYLFLFAYFRPSTLLRSTLYSSVATAEDTLQRERRWFDEKSRKVYLSRVFGGVFQGDKLVKQSIFSV